MATDKIRLNSSSVKTTGAKTVTETKEPEIETSVSTPKVTTETEATYSPFRKVDGGVDQAAVNEFNTNYRDPLANAYDIDPVTGRYKGDVGALLGFDPDKYKAEQEAKARLERFKQKEAGWRNALGVVTDIATAAAGGNVYKRDKDEIAKKAGENADKANLTVQGLGKAVDDAVKGRELAYEQGRLKSLNQYIKDFAVKVKQQNTQGGDKQTTTAGGGKVTTTSGGKEITNGYKDAIPRTYSSRGGGSGSGTKNGYVVMTLPKQDKDGNHTGFDQKEVPIAYAKAYKARLQNTIQKLIIDNDNKKKKNQDPSIEKIKTDLIRQGVLIDDGGDYKWNDDDNRYYNLLSSFTNVDANLASLLNDIYKKAYNNPNGKDTNFVPIGERSDGGWSGADDSTADEYDM